MTNRVRIYEVSPRDGLQNEARIIPTPDKVRLVDLLSACGFERIEVASFVSPTRVPQMADGAEVLQGISRVPGTRYAALTPNLIGFERARRAAADEVAVLIAASEAFSWANLNCSIVESLERAEAIARAAALCGVPVRGYLSCVVACPYDGPTEPDTAARLAAALVELGCYEVSLGDTIGAGTPESIAALLDAVLRRVPAELLAGHYHDTGGLALANIDATLARGVRTIDASVGGLGGCPFAPGAKGNVDTMAVLRHLHLQGFATGVDEGRAAQAASFASSLGRASV